MKISLREETLDVSVVIPSLHEASNLYRLLPLLGEALDGVTAQWEVIVVDGDSKDGTDKIVGENGERFRYVC